MGSKPTTATSHARKGNLIGTTDARLIAWIKAREVGLFERCWHLSDVRNYFHEQCDNSLWVSMKDFRTCVVENCEFLGKKLRAESKAVAFGDAQWSRLKDIVTEMQDHIRTVRLDGALRLVRTRMAVNATLMRGLSSKYRVWIV